MSLGIASGYSHSKTPFPLPYPEEISANMAVCSRQKYRGADKSLFQPTSRCILFDGENISFDSSFVIYINSTNIPAIMIINWIYQNQNLLLL
jgi:hypothetical protein